MNAGTSAKNSEYMGTAAGGIGIDGGENAPWRQTTSEQIYDATVGGVGTFLFGQEEETVTCEMTAGEYSHCGDVVHQLENEGETTNVYSPDESGVYSKYGLKGGERISGSDPAILEDGQRVEVTIVTQPENEGAVSKSAKTLEIASDSVQDTIDDILGGESDSGGDENESTASEESTPIIDAYHTERKSSRSSRFGSNDRTSSTGSSNSVSLVSGHSHSHTPSRSKSSSSGGVSGGTGSESTVGLLA